MKNLFYLQKDRLFLLFATLLLQCGCKNDQQDIAIENFTLDVSDVMIEVEEVQPVIVSPSPENITDKIIWESADPEIAQVQSNDNGLVSGIMGLKVGSTTITASTKDRKIKQAVQVNVIVKVQSITFTPEVVLSPSQVQYAVNFTPENPTFKELIWTSSNPGVASVSNGVVTAISRGSSIITATTLEGGKKASIEVFVSGNPPTFGKEYCTIVGSGDYCPSEIRTDGAVQDLIHVNDVIPINNYKYYEGDKLVVKRSGSFTLTLVQSNNWSCSAVWIDWNGGRNFTNDDEQVAIFGDFETLNDGPFSKLINVPTNAVLGLVRMRVITVDAWGDDLSTFEPCGSVIYGTIKDFDVEIIE